MVTSLDFENRSLGEITLGVDVALLEPKQMTRSSKKVQKGVHTPRNHGIEKNVNISEKGGLFSAKRSANSVKRIIFDCIKFANQLL